MTGKIEKMVKMDSLIAFLSIFASALGVSWVSRDYLSSLIGGVILRKIKRLEPGTRIKVLTSQIVKGDILHIGLFRTTLIEVGRDHTLYNVRLLCRDRVPLLSYTYNLLCRIW